MMTHDPTPTIDAAYACWRAGISVVPTKRDKRPDSDRLPINPETRKPGWKPLQERLATENEMQTWFGQNGHSAFGYATIGGKVSGNLEILDFDNPDHYPSDTAEKTLAAFTAKIETIQPGLMAKLSADKTMSDGRHLRYRCESPVDGDAKLAMIPAIDDQGELVTKADGTIAPTTLIETRGEGGYAVGPGTPGYVHLSGPPISELTVLTAEERDVLLRVARSFDQLSDQCDSDDDDFRAENLFGETPTLRPGDDFNQRGDWRPLLDALGLKHKFTDKSGVQFFQRISSKNPIAANLGFGGKDLLRVFSSNLPIPASPKSYNKFAVYTLLHHNGDFSAAAKALAAEGYGSPKRTATGGPRQEAPPDIPLDARHSLRVVAARRTASGKVTAQVKLLRDGQPAAMLGVSSALSSQKAAVKMLAEFVPVDHAALASAIGKLIADTDDRLRRAAESGGAAETVRAIVAREVPPKFALKFRMSDGKLWSDSWGRGISRQEFLAFTPGWLVDQCRVAPDADESDGALVRAIQTALSVVWATIGETLPNHAGDADGLTSAAERFAADVFRVWTSPALGKNVSIAGADGELGVVRTSLASLVFDLKSSGQTLAQGKWQQIRQSIPAYVRLDRSDGKQALRLGMRFDLFHTLRVHSEFATDQKAMHAFGRKAGVFSDDGIVTGRMTAGGRLAILSPAIQAQILAQPVDDESTSDDGEDQ